MAIMQTDELLAEASDHWAKTPDSNFYKLFDCMATPLNRLSDNSNRVVDWRDITKASGATLDMIGIDKSCRRIDSDDEFYRWLLKIKAMVFVNDPTIDNIERIVQAVFETKNYNLEVKPGNQVLITLPASVLPQNLSKRAILLEYIQSLPAAGFGITLHFMSESNTIAYVSVGQVVRTSASAESDTNQEL